MDGMGDVICSLDELLLVAAERWRTPLTQQGLAHISGLSRSTLSELLSHRSVPASAIVKEASPYQGRIALRTIAALCSVFICLPGELLRYRAPGQTLARLSPNCVRRTEAPPQLVPTYPLTNRIPDQLQAYTPTALMRRTGVSWSTWARVKRGTSQIELSMLAAICALLSTDVSSLLVHTVPFRNATWSIRFVRWDDQRLIIDLTNDVTVSVYPARWQALALASAEARNRWHLTDDRQGVRWDDLGIEIYPRLLLD